MKQERKVVRQMVELYCRKHEGNAELCRDCRELLEYAESRLEHCQFGNSKPSCRRCPVHCYKPDMRERIRAVMRWSGPRMIFHHPLAAIRHLIRERLSRHLLIVR